MHTTYKVISRNLSKRMLGHALTMLRPIVAESGENYVDRWLSLQKNYQYVADYFMSGKDDPHREEVIDLLIRDAYLLLDEIYLQKRKKESSSMEIIELARAPHSFDTPADAFRFFWLSDLQEWDLEACLRLAGNVEMGRRKSDVGLGIDAEYAQVILLSKYIVYDIHCSRGIRTMYKRTSLGKSASAFIAIR